MVEIFVPTTFQDQMAEFQNRIRELRRARAWTTEDLASRAGTTQATISRLEQNKQGLTVEWLYKIAAALEVRAVDLLEKDEKIAYVGVVGELNRKYGPDESILRRDSGLIVVPIFHNVLRTNYADAFKNGENGWIIADANLSRYAQTEGSKYVVLLKDDSGHEFNLRVAQQSGSGSGYLATEGDPAKRWVRMGDPRIQRAWRAIAEWKEFEGSSC